MVSIASTFQRDVALKQDVLEVAYRKVTTHLIPFIFICYLFNYLDRVNVGFAKLQMLDALKWSETSYGLGAGIFFIGYVLSGIPSNLILHKIGARRVIGTLMIAWGTASACLLFVTTPLEFYTLRFVTGIFEAGFFPGIVLYFTRWYPSARRGRVWVCLCRQFQFPACWAVHSLAGCCS